MFRSASSFARKLSLAIVVTLFASLQVPAASATSERTFYDCETGVQGAESDPAVYGVVEGQAFNKNCTGDVLLPDGITGISLGGFEGSQITSITIPASVTMISDYAFIGATNLADVYLLGNAPDTVGVEVFDYLPAGAKAHITATATGFGNGPTWYGLIVERATAVPEDGFYDCATGVKRADSNETGFKILNGNVSNIDCTGAVVLPSGLTQIRGYAFFGSAITSITIPSGVTSIGESAFEGSSSLSQVVLPSTLEFIDWYAFGYNTSLTSITIPASVTYITVEAFYDSSIEDFYFLGNAPGYVADYAFDSVAAGAKAHITATATGFGTEPTWKGLIVERALESYTVTFDSKSGSHVTAGSFVSGGSIDIPFDPTRAGYTFMGWSATLGGPSITFPYSPGVTQDITLYAKWSANSYTVTFDSLGGTPVSEQSFTTGGSVDAPTPPTRAGYTFEGWSATNGGSAISFPYSPSTTQEITLYALWAADSHTVTFNSKGGSSIASGSFVSGGSINNSASPSSSQFFNDALPENAYIAQLDDQVHMGNEVSTSESGWVKQVRYYRLSGDDSAISASVWSSEGVLLGSQLFAGGTESGWQSVTFDEPVYMSANETFYVSVLTPSTPYGVGVTNVQPNAGPWSLIGYAMSGPEDSFIPIDGTEDVFVLVDLVFETQAVPIPTRAGYTFLGWSATDGGSVISFPYTPGVTEDITLYANWSRLAYDVTFDSKSGSSVADTVFDADGSIAAPTPPTREGYVFLGWSATDGGSTVSFPYSPGVAEDITLYAIWTLDTYTVTFNSNGGDDVDGDSFVFNGSVSEPIAPTRDGYTFLGWSATNGGNAISFPYTPGVAEDITLYALWSAESYTVTFNSMGGGDVDDLSFSAYGSFFAPANPSRAGYTFLGWSATEDGSAISFPYTPGVTEDILLFALWSTNSHTVTFDSKGGSSVTSGAFYTEGEVSAPSAPTRDGYTFLGWSDTDGGSAISFPYVPDVTENITLYALWSANSYTVTFDSKSGSYVWSSSFVTEGSFTAPADPTRNGYTFLGWSDTDSGSAISFPYAPGVIENITLYALWSANTYTVSFETYGGSSVADTSYVTDGTFYLPPAPSRLGYTFAGWATYDGTLLSTTYTPGVMSNITVYAWWTAKRYVISFNEKGGSEIPDASFVTGEYLSYYPALFSSYRPGYSLLGWSATDGGPAIDLPYYPGVMSNITLYALWSPDVHNIWYFSNGSITHYLSYVTDGSVIAPSDPVRAGYTFLGWSATEGGSAVSFPYAPGGTGFKAMHALWSINTYTVTYDSKGGTSVGTASFVYGGGVDSAPRTPYLSGAVFMGWSATDGGDAVSFPYHPGGASNVTLYAKWTFLAPLLSTSRMATVLPGDTLMIRVSRVNVGCTVTVGWLQENTGVSSISKVIKADRTSGVFTIATPSTAGRYTLTTSTIGGECSNGAAVTLARAFTVGKKSSVVAKLSSSSASVSKNPVVTVSGKVKSGTVAVVGRSMTVSLRRNGVEVVSATVNTDSSGAFVASFSGITYLAGEYTTVVTGVADSTYLASEGVANKITLR
ncbi:MAG: InlB B-repeat-containing protein [Rhodoluna sp.]